MSNIDENEILRRLEELSQIKPTAESTERAINRARQTIADSESHKAQRIIFKSPIIRFAAAAALLICAGYIIGRVTSAQPINIEQLRAEIETSLKSSLSANYEQIKDELHQQVQQDLTEFAAQTLAASTTMTDQRLMELIRMIDAARMQDYLRVAAAIEKIEMDKARLGDGLQALATKTSELLRMEQSITPSKTGG
ncbi:MAG: hypothetical protein A2173_04330 [Planctomycetes bacterium RBG_13_44_8b]|nr:MAG: hypothetical protein A2173_04330 [Planctomycetes bacterium RBG_13_44_8b]